MEESLRKQVDHVRRVCDACVGHKTAEVRHVRINLGDAASTGWQEKEWMGSDIF